MPVTAEVGGFGWYGDDVAHADGDVAVAAGAEIHLVRLVRLDEARFGVFPKVELWLLAHYFSVPVRVSKT